MYFYHPDHLGSSSYITDREGRITQHTEYIAFGEVLFEEHSTSRTMPYLFNGKELDTETNLTYFGARYLDMKTSLWLNTDPLSGYNPIQETEHYIDGQHNGGIYNPMNIATYSYTYNNPVKWIDPNGKQVNHSVLLESNYVSLKLRTGDTRTYQNGYKFTNATIHLINLVTSVNKDYISNAIIKFSKIGDAGASITLGPSPSQAEITHYYSDKVTYKETNGGYFNEFLQRNVHEVGHIPQLKNGTIAHIASSLLEYGLNILDGQDWHDGSNSKKEQQANVGENRFTTFNKWIDDTYGKDKLKKLFENKKNTQDDIIGRVNQWWKAYTTNKFGNSDNANK